MADGKARGGTLFVTLEPCSHYGRTPPCTNAIIDAGVKRVVVAVNDPNPLVCGKGVAQLRSAGMQVEKGLLKEEATAVNEDFFWAITHRRAWITLKLGLTLDGRIADSTGASQWITGKEARGFVHELRRRHAAVAVGRGTLEHDDPRLTVRTVKGYNPARIVFTGSAKNIPPSSYFATHAKEARTIVVVAGAGKREIVSQGGVEYWHTGRKSAASSLKTFAEMAFVNNLTSVLVEGGQKLASSFLENGLVNRMYLMFGNKMVGDGKDGILFEKGLGINNCFRLDEMKTCLLGDTIVITGFPGIKK
jgi:diaminohydroxyphosphoribosylaminopyrimidine deaminase/5-amino-6-(5-phosphoribosylamino)uracil reductase